VTPLPGARAPEIHSDGSVATRDGKTSYDDGAHADLVLQVPEGWTAQTSFAANDDGPPAAGELRLRMRLGPEPACVVDLAFEPSVASEERLRESISRGREVFFFARIDEPSPSLPHGRLWTSTAIPVKAGRADIGYWIESEGQLLRLEGRFPSDRVPECKRALDAVLESLSVRGATGATSRRAPPVNPG